MLGCRTSSARRVAASQAQVRELTAIVRNQIPSGRKPLLDAYAEVAYQAWRHTQGACRYEVEHTLLQVLSPPPSFAIAVMQWAFAPNAEAPSPHHTFHSCPEKHCSSVPSQISTAHLRRQCHRA